MDMSHALGKKIQMNITYWTASSPRDPIKIMKTETLGSFVMAEDMELGLIKYLLRLASLKIDCLLN